MKTCIECGTDSPLTDFRKGRICNPCDNAKRREKARTPEGKAATKKRNAKYHAKNRDKILLQQKMTSKDRMLQHRYGVSAEWFDATLEGQGGCAICQVSPGTEDVRFCVDHDHDTGEIRGILCAKCNTAIGLLNDNRGIVFKAYQYLDSHENREPNAY